MKTKVLTALCVVLLFFVAATNFAFAESKTPSGGVIPKLLKTANDPILENGGVYPMWGPVCQRYTYHTTYKDKEGRAPEYVRMYFNGEWLDVSKENPDDNDYKKGVKYIYKYVPTKLGSNFFFFEASNGIGKTREGIIDSPGNGPVLFEGDFKDNEIALIDGKSGQKVWSFPTGSTWVSGVALSDDGKYLAALTPSNVYLFDTSKAKPIWTFSTRFNIDTPGDVKGGIDISGDGSKIFASVGNQAYLFNSQSEKPLWTSSIGSNGAYSAAISKDGKYMAVGTAGDETNQNSNLLMVWSESSSTPLWQYHSSGNFHEVSLSDDGKYIAGATGCPDRRAYLFSKDSNEPLLRSEMLTRDSPVDEAQISGNGQLAAYGLESDQGGLIIFKNGDNKPLWRYDTQNRNSIRALSITNSGKFILAGTFGGEVLLFDVNSNQPQASWKVSASVGAVGISDNGEVLAIGGADSKVHLYNSKDKDYQHEIDLGEYVGEIDVSANGQYVAAGTSGSTYFFETFSPNEGKVFPCDTITEPPPAQTTAVNTPANQNNAKTVDGCTIDCDPKKIAPPENKLPGMVFGVAFSFSFLVLVFYLLIIKFTVFGRIKKIGSRICNAKLIAPLRLSTRKIVVTLITLTGIFLALTIAAVIINRTTTTGTKPVEPAKTETAEPTKNGDTPQTTPQDKSGTSSGKEKTPVCGNTMCEPDFGESKETCPNDCSGDQSSPIP